MKKWPEKPGRQEKGSEVADNEISVLRGTGFASLFCTPEARYKSDASRWWTRWSEPKERLLATGTAGLLLRSTQSWLSQNVDSQTKVKLKGQNSSLLLRKNALETYLLEKTEPPWDEKWWGREFRFWRYADFEVALSGLQLTLTIQFGLPVASKFF